MTLGQYQRGVGVFPSRQAAENALEHLRDADFPMNQVSVIARNEEQIAGVDVQDDTENEAGGGAAAGAVAGGVTGGIVGLIGTLGAIALPGVGPILVGGAAASVIGNTLLGGAVGSAAGGLFGALIGLEIPEAEAKLYQDRLEKGHYLILVDGTPDQITRAASILKPRGIQEWRSYERPTVNTPVSTYTHPTTAAQVGYPTPLGAAYTGPFGEPFGATPTGVTPSPPSTAPVKQTQRAMGIFSDEQNLKNALDELKSAGFDMNHISVIAKDAEHPDQVAGVRVTDPLSHDKARDAATGTVAGGVLGGLTGLLVGLVTLAVPGVGPVVFVGTEAAVIASALGGGAIGAAAGGLVGILANLGVPEEQAKKYSHRLSHGDYLVLVQGTDEQIQQAETILRDRGIEEWDIYNSPSAPMTHPGRVFP